jgi:hypothetical protein
VQVIETRALWVEGSNLRLFNPQLYLIEWKAYDKLGHAAVWIGPDALTFRLPHGSTITIEYDHGSLPRAPLLNMVEHDCKVGLVQHLTKMMCTGGVVRP